MKKFVFFFSFVLMGFTSVLFAQKDDDKADFSAVCSSGQVLYYKIVDFGEVNVWYQEEYPELLGGFVKIPRTVRYNDENYVVTGIGNGCFSNCIRVQGMELPTTMFYIGNAAFAHCTDLRFIEMPKTLTTIGDWAFEDCPSLIDVVMPNSVWQVGAYAFKDCVNVRHFVISHGLTEIPEGCFENCASVTDYLIPANITSFGCGAFDGYAKLKSVIFLGTVPPQPVCADEPSFGREIPITVTKQAFDAFKASYIWGQYTIKSM